MESIPSGVSANITDSHHSKEITPGCVNALMASKHDSGVIVGGIKVIGNYSPSNHNASRIVSVDGVAPTVMENHGTVTAVAVENEARK